MSLLTPLRRLRPGLVARPRSRTLNSPHADIRTLPDPTVTPAERAWMALWHLERNPSEWVQSTYGAYLPDGTTVGCFAHHLVKQAGYDTFGCEHRFQGVQCLSECRECALEQRPCTGAGYVHTENGWEEVPRVADRLLGIPAHSADGVLYRGSNTLKDLRACLVATFGDEPENRA